MAYQCGMCNAYCEPENRIHVILDWASDIEHAKSHVATHVQILGNNMVPWVIRELETHGLPPLFRGRLLEVTEVKEREPEEPPDPTYTLRVLVKLKVASTEELAQSETLSDISGSKPQLVSEPF